MDAILLNNKPECKCGDLNMKVSNFMFSQRLPRTKVHVHCFCASTSTTSEIENSLSISIAFLLASHNLQLAKYLNLCCIATSKVFVLNYYIKGLCAELLLQDAAVLQAQVCSVFTKQNFQQEILLQF